MRKRCVRKAWALVNPIEHAAYQASRLTVAEWNRQMAPVVTATEQLALGKWDPLRDWNPLFHALNRIESMLHIARMPDHGFIARAQDAFVSALDRQQRTGAKAFNADELSTIREVSQVYGDLLKEVTHRDFQAACAHTQANVDRITKQRGKGITVTNHCVIERKNQEAGC